MKAIVWGAVAFLVMAAVFLCWHETAGSTAQRLSDSSAPPVGIALPREGNDDLDRTSLEPTHHPGSTAPMPIASGAPTPAAIARSEVATVPLPVFSTSRNPTFSATPHLRELPIEIEIRDIVTQRSHILADTERVSEFVDILVQSSLISNNASALGTRYTYSFFLDGMYWHYDASNGAVGRHSNLGHTGTYLIRDELRPRFRALITGENPAPPKAKASAAP